MKKIYYLGYYDTVENKAENRNIVLAATNKMTYIIDAIEKAGYSVEVISASQTKDSVGYPAKTVTIGENSKLHLFKTLPWGNKIRKVLSIFSMRRQYQNFILKNVGPNDTLIAYHSIPYAEFLARAKKKIGFRLIMEVEEIYADVSGREKDRKKENKVFTAADAFIFPTEFLNKKLNINKKPYTIIHGTYQVEPKKSTKNSDGKKHIVYAGTFDPRKGGAIAAVGAAKYLDVDYQIHIIGFGSNADKQNLLAEIEKINESSKCKVTFDGLLSGEEYINFLQSCDIGLSTQNPEGVYNDTSFPSKILSYMANGLRVVSVKIPVVETSAIGGYMYYYEHQTPQEIAQTIKKIDYEQAYNSREIIEKLDKKFVDDISRLI